MMWPRLELPRELLAEDGSIWVSIDDNEAHFLKVVMDEVFGRWRFIASNVWQKRYSRENRGAIGAAREYVLVYAKSPESFRKSRNRVPLNETQAKIYKNPENPKEQDPAKRWRGLPMTAQGYRPNQMYQIVSPFGKVFLPPKGRCWSMIESELENYGEVSIVGTRDREPTRTDGSRRSTSADARCGPVSPRPRSRPGTVTGAANSARHPIGPNRNPCWRRADSPIHESNRFSPHPPATGIYRPSAYANHRSTAP